MVRWFAFVGLALCVILVVTWGFGFFGPFFTHPNASRYEFGAPEGTELRVRDGKLEVLTPVSHWVAGPAKFSLEAATVVILFVVAVTGCVLVLRQGRKGN